MEENKKSWGGAREGAGRKLSGTGKRVTCSYRIDPGTKETLVTKAAEFGISVGELIDRLAKTL